MISNCYFKRTAQVRNLLLIKYCPFQLYSVINVVTYIIADLKFDSSVLPFDCNGIKWGQYWLGNMILSCAFNHKVHNADTYFVNFITRGLSYNETTSIKKISMILLSSLETRQFILKNQYAKLY